LVCFCSFARIAAQPAAFAADSAPRFQGDSLPDPPAQNRKFTTPSDAKLPEAFLTATAALFELGLADPRDCEYREVQLAIGDQKSGDGGVVKVHGWAIPSKPGDAPDAPRFAVAWNGLVYPAVAIGKKADLPSDVERQCKEDVAARARWKNEYPNEDYDQFRAGFSEEVGAAEQNLMPIRACLLLRLGEAALAEKVWRKWSDSKEPDPFLALAGDWLWARFGRAVCAHMRGEDRLGLIDSQWLTTMQKRADAIARERGFKREEGHEKSDTYFEFLESVPRLLADQKQRLAKKPAAKEGQAEPRDKRIARLVADLEYAAPLPSGEHRFGGLGTDPRVQSLVSAGDAAVPQLLDCLEKDDRLTRLAEFGKEGPRSCDLIGVDRAAFMALSLILRESFF